MVGVSGSDSVRGSEVVEDSFVGVLCLRGRANVVNSSKGPKRRPREPRVLSSGEPAKPSSSGGGITVVLKIMRSHLKVQG
jgi:hypothetical protein